MRTYEMAYKEVADILEKAEVFDYEVDSRLLLYDICDIDATFFLIHKKDEIDEADYDRLLKAAQLRTSKMPLQYITHKAYFMGFEFYVDENVLIPRMDTECLVSEALNVIKDGDRVLDMCTGSGCIIESIAAIKKDISATAVDISEGALMVAKKNAKQLNIDNIDFIQSDLFENVSGKYDVIVSNPPYIRTDVIAGLMEEVKDYEPMNALDGYEDGLYFYRRIIDDLPGYLNKDGCVLFEIGHDQGDDVRKMLEDKGFGMCRVIKDLAGLDRVVFAKY